jgi:hypothetical protein
MVKLITNQWDRDNLEFLLNTKGDDFAAWHAQADEDDLAYAQELMDAYSLELKLRSEALEIECLIERKGTPEANRVIDQFRLTK